MEPLLNRTSTRPPDRNMALSEEYRRREPYNHLHLLKMALTENCSETTPK
jgi:hypothetical protein